MNSPATIPYLGLTRAGTDGEDVDQALRPSRPPKPATSAWSAGSDPKARSTEQESRTGSYGAGLTRHLSRAGITMVEVDRANRRSGPTPSGSGSGSVPLPAPPTSARTSNESGTFPVTSGNSFPPSQLVGHQALPIGRHSPWPNQPGTLPHGKPFRTGVRMLASTHAFSQFGRAFRALTELSYEQSWPV